MDASSHFQPYHHQMPLHFDHLGQSIPGRFELCMQSLHLFLLPLPVLRHQPRQGGVEVEKVGR